MTHYYNFLKKKLFSVYIVYIVVFSILAYAAYAIYSKNNFMKYEQKHSTEVIHKIEGYMESSMNIATMLTDDSTVSGFSQKNSPGSPAMLNEVCKKISSVGFFENMDYYIGLVSPEKDRVAMPSGSLSYHFFLNSFGLDETVTTQAVQQLSSANKNDRLMFIAHSDTGRSHFIVSVISCKSKLDDPNIFVFLYDVKSFFSGISRGSIDSVTELNFKKYNASVLYNEKTEEVPTEAEIPRFKKTVSAHTFSNYFGEVYYTSYIPYLSYIIHLNSFFILFILLVLTLSFVLLAAANSNVNNLYSPVKKLVKSLPKGELNEETGEFEAIQSYITSLVDQKNIMNEIISESKINLTDKFLLQLMTQTLTNMQIKEGIITHHLDSVNFPLVCFIVTYRNYQELKSMLTNDGLNDIRLSINEILNANLDSSRYLKIIDMDLQTTVCISSIDNSEAFINRLKKAALNIEMLLDVDLIIYLGKKASSWYAVPQSYNSALSLKNNLAILSDNNMVISAENNPTGCVPKTIEYSSEIEDNILNAVTAMDANKAMEYINKTIDVNMSGTLFTREYYFQFVIMLYSTVTKLLASIGKTEKEVFGDVKIYLELIECSNTQELKTKMAYFINLIINNKVTIQKDVDDVATKRIIDYINKNYANDISLFTLADYLNVSQSYASKIFKSQMGENFKDYLTSFRLNKAVEIMRENPYMKIGDVAKQVGYTSFTFTRVFTQKYGMTPSDYMQK